MPLPVGVLDELLFVFVPEPFVGDVVPGCGGVVVVQAFEEVADVVMPALAGAALPAVGWTIFCGFWCPARGKFAPPVVGK